MSRKKNLLLLFLSSVMILLYIYPWTNFLFSLLPYNSVSFSDLAVIFLSASALVFLSGILCSRNITVLLILISGWLISVFVLFNSYFRLPVLSADAFRFSDYIFPEKTIHGVLTAMLLYGLVTYLWISAFRAVKKPLSIEKVNHHFDKGLAFLLALLLLKLLIAVKGGVIPPDNSLAGALVSYFLLGIFFLGFVRKGGSGAAQVLIILVFGFLVFYITSGITIMFYPELKTMAETGSGMLGGAAGFFERSLVVLIRFFMDFRYRKAILAEIAGKDDSSAPVLTMETGPADNIILYIFLGFLVLLFAAAAAGILVFLFNRIIRWLFAQNNKEKKPDDFLSLIRGVIGFFQKLASLFHRKKERGNPAALYYRMLCRWGKLTGNSGEVSDTPGEYAVQLSARYPGIEDEINCIVALHDEAVYGCILPGREQVKKARHALLKLYNPVEMLRSLRIKL